MPTLSINIPIGARNDAKGFSLVEMIIAITISSMIIGGSTFFIFKTNSEAQTAKNRTKIHVEMSEYIEKMNQIRNGYSSGTVLIQNEPGYDVLLFSNSGATAGVLVGVVNLADPDANGGVRLDTV
jgi:prepilin-type N-terminal cleavage/methylation domain-containing protein